MLQKRNLWLGKCIFHHITGTNDFIFDFNARFSCRIDLVESIRKVNKENLLIYINGGFIGYCSGSKITNMDGGKSF